jgi:hypothetical protein
MDKDKNKIENIFFEDLKYKFLGDLKNILVFLGILVRKQPNHSKITNFPIDYELYPKTKDVEFIEIDLYKNDYLFIPEGWIHWVISDPYTSAISYTIANIFDENTKLFNHLKNLEYYIGKGDPNINFDTNTYLNNNINNKFTVIFSDTYEVCPVNKNNSII